MVEPDLIPSNFDRMRGKRQQDEVALAAYGAYWNRELQLEMEKPKGSVDKFEESKDVVEAFIKKSIPPAVWQRKQFGLSSHLDRILGGISWYHVHNPQPNYNDLIYFGINPQGIESVWGPLVEISRQYCQTWLSAPNNHKMQTTFTERKTRATEVFTGLDRKYNSFYSQNKPAVDETIAAFYRDDELSTIAPASQGVLLTNRLKALAQQRLVDELQLTSDTVPISYRWMDKLDISGITLPSFTELVKFNRAFVNGQQIDLYCCPNYSLNRRADGTYVYTFDSLGSDIGLTAQRGFPFMERLVERAVELATKGALKNTPSFRVGIADFEATEANTDMVNLTVDQFNYRLGQSVENMLSTVSASLHSRNGRSEISYNIARSNHLSQPIGEWQINLVREGVVLTTISFGAITQTYVDKIPNYDGLPSFQQRVAQQRAQLEARAIQDGLFQSRLDALLKLRLGLMLRWRDGAEPPTVTRLGEMFDTISTAEFQTQLHNFRELDSLPHEVNQILQDSSYPEGAKDVVIKAIIVNWLTGRSRTDPAALEAVEFLRRKIARQGAEYAVMAQLQERSGIGAQIVADSYPMWQVFSGAKIPKIVIKGGYEGA